MSEKRRIEYLISVLKDHIEDIPKYTDRLEAIDSINKMIEEQADEKDYVIALADGLKYGNWPWTRYGGTLRTAIKSSIPTCDHRFRDGICMKCGGEEYTGQDGV